LGKLDDDTIIFVHGAFCGGWAFERFPGRSKSRYKRTRHRCLP